MQVKKRRGRPRKQQNIKPIPSLIDFKNITTLGNLNIDKRMLESMPTKSKTVDEFLSHEQGIPCASNIMAIGDPGVGKTTVLLDILSKIEKTGRKCLFISGEMGEKQMFKYTQRFPQFENVKTLFLSNYLEFNTKDVVEQVMDMGFDLILIDSIAEVMGGVRDDNGWDRKTAESWLVENCTKQNKGNNKENKFTSFLLIQQVTKQGDAVGSNKLKHMTDATLEMRRESERDGGGIYMEFTKNRNGLVGKKLMLDLNTNNIHYKHIVGLEE